MRTTIVCVDDEWAILKSLGDQLKRNFGKDYDIELVDNGVEALLLCAELTAEGSDISLIISDQKMYGMEGDDLLIQLHTLYPRTLKIMFHSNPQQPHQPACSESTARVLLRSSVGARPGR